MSEGRHYFGELVGQVTATAPGVTRLKVDRDVLEGVIREYMALVRTVQEIRAAMIQGAVERRKDSK